MRTPQKLRKETRLVKTNKAHLFTFAMVPPETALYQRDKKFPKSLRGTPYWNIQMYKIPV